MNITKYILSTAFCLVSVCSYGAGKYDVKKTARELEVYVKTLQYLDMFYVDSLDMGEVQRSGIDAMLENLDPYTTYYSAEKMSDLEFMTTGKYAGVGALISERGDYIEISEIYKGTPSDLSGMKVGDRIVKVDTFTIFGKNTSDVSIKLRGEPNTKVNVVIERPYTNGQLTFKINRQLIEIPSIKLYKMVDSNTGYISVDGFTRNTAEQFKKAFTKLKSEGMTNLIIDLRNNPGGLLDEATALLNMFVKKGTKLLYTDGKVKDWNETYIATKEPADLTIPIVVLVNDESASAAEIVAGALQDLDRAVVVGEKTFGKGIVQTTRDLPYGGSLKLTVSKYYIPSKRCIQKINYTEKHKQFILGAKTDSVANEYFTVGGRKVYGGGGITPDTVVVLPSFSDICHTLVSEYYIFDYVTKYMSENKTVPASMSDIKFTDFDGFKSFLISKDFIYKTKTEKMMDKLIETAKSDSLYEKSRSQIESLQIAMAVCQDMELDKNKNAIISLIEYEIAKRYFYQEGAINAIIKDDKQLKTAISILNNQDLYKSILQIK